MKPALSQVCSLDWPFEKDVEGYAAGACPAIELWVGKLDAYLERHTTADVRQLLAEHRLVAPVASFQGGLLVNQEPFRQEHRDAFERRLKQCGELGVETLVIAGDIDRPLSQQGFEEVKAALAAAATSAGRRGVRLAFEFQAHAAFANNLETAAALVAEISSPHLGLCLDVFHYYLGPSKFEDLGYLSADNLFHVQLSDLAGVPREWASDADRILPGEGDFQLQPIIERLRAIGYAGHVSVELMNPQIWRIDPVQFGEIATTALRRVLGQASMG
ncbi:MAG TPA: sugar phosphate isomerase/epimerase [Pirellulales bacterium]|nr:sugar phosphate isomerase/epimerase [Pirellulales bacterium]